MAEEPWTRIALRRDGRHDVKVPFSGNWEDTMSLVEKSTVSKVAWRLMPFLFICYFFNVLDRVNVGFAALTMNEDLGFSATVFGTGASLFFVAYVLAEVPSNVLMHKLGARIWIARIMISWGILAGAQAFVWDDMSFYAVRFALGLAEAGFFPGLVYYLAQWYPAQYRSRTFAQLMAVSPFSSVIGAPVSAWLLGFTAFGLVGWQLMFIIQAVPSIFLGIICLIFLTNRPEEATWLNLDEKAWLTQTLQAEEQAKQAVRTYGFWEALFNWKVLMLSAIEFGLVMANWGMSFWLPQIVKGFGGLSNLQVGFISAIPFVGALIAMQLWSWSSDRSLERRFHLTFACLVAALGIGAGALIASPVLKLVALSIGIMGFWSALSVFWAVPTAFLGGLAGAGAIAFINSVAQFGGILSPWLMGYSKDATGGFTLGLLVISGCCFISVILSLFVTNDERDQKAAKGLVQSPQPGE
jgi:sugar phosphate permease